MPIMTTEQEVGARLYRFAHVWERYGCPQWIVRTLAKGYRPKFLLLPPLTTRPRLFGRFRSPKREIRVSLTKDMLVKGAIEPVKDLFGRVLQPSLPSTEGLRRVPAGDRPILSQPSFRHGGNMAATSTLCSSRSVYM